ncbi:hypothetical protein AAVH_00700 [Aphelenchoides avenae]|nr:hypothetical protein AAVH_00700 [Aphelenchus avenae]
MNRSTERDADRAVSASGSGIRLVTFPGHQPPVYTRGHEMIGRLILPDLIELDPSATDYAHEFARSGYLTAYDADTFENDLATDGHQVTRLVFGRPVESEPLFDKIRSHRGKPIVRFV